MWGEEVRPVYVVGRFSSAVLSCSGAGLKQEYLDFRRPGFDQISLMGAAGKEGWVLYNKESGLIKKRGATFALATGR